MEFNDRHPDINYTSLTPGHIGNGVKVCSCQPAKVSCWEASRLISLGLRWNKNSGSKPSPSRSAELKVGHFLKIEVWSDLRNTHCHVIRIVFCVEECLLKILIQICKPPHYLAQDDAASKAKVFNGSCWNKAGGCQPRRDEGEHEAQG